MRVCYPKRNIYSFATVMFFFIKVYIRLKRISDNLQRVCSILLQVFGSRKEEPSSPEIRFSSVTQRDTEDKVVVTKTLSTCEIYPFHFSTFEGKPCSSDA